MKRTGLPFLLPIVCYTIQVVLLSSCANIIPPVGGSRDTIPPTLIRAIPEQGTKNFKGNRINLYFDEYVEVQSAFENVLISPAQERFPLIDYKLRNVSVKIKDTLEPNTTYSIQFGDAVKDVNEGNVLKNFSYVFSTGNTIDSLSLEGTVLVAETGKVDSTIIVILHRNLDDSAVAKEKPRYITRLNGEGHFRFNYLPAGTFGLFALKDEGFKKYSDNKILFAFADKPISTGSDNTSIDLLAFIGEKDEKKNTTPGRGSGTPAKESKEDKRLKFQINLENGQQNLEKDVLLSFSKPLKTLDSSKIILTDTFYNPVKGYRMFLDSSKEKLSIRYPWQEMQYFKLLLLKDAATDTSGNTITRNDTIRFQTRPEDSYGTIQIRFTGLELAKNPVLQWIQGDQVYKSYPITGKDLTMKRFEPNSYEMRILYDENKNGIWDTGNYWKKKQPEKVISIDQKFNIRSNWDNEFTVPL